MPDDLTDYDPRRAGLRAPVVAAPGSKEAVLLERFGLTPTEHYRRLKKAAH